MKKCPVCHQTFTQGMLLKKSISKSFSKRLSEQFTDGKGVIRCPHCNARLRKKISVWFIPALMPFFVSAVLYPINSFFEPLMYLSIVFFMLFYINLPYVPYDSPYDKE